jgi:starch-binding outer membrane protein, SusD/RagB family
MKTLTVIFLLLLVGTESCDDNFLKTLPQGEVSDYNLSNEDGINGLLIGAYAYLDGSNGTTVQSWYGSVSNWIWGSMASDDATKGSDISDESPILPIEFFSADPQNGCLEGKWSICYEGIARCNVVLKMLAKTGRLSDQYIRSVKAQSLFLRAWQHFELKRVFNNIPYITEEVENPAKVINTIDTWPLIEKDLQYAVANLPETQSDVGRPTRYAAMAVLARVYLFQKKWIEAAALLDQIIQNTRYSLMTDFHDNYRIPTRNNAESIFEIQYSVNDGSYNSGNAGWGDALNFPVDIDGLGTCCGFHQPTQNLINAFKVDPNGLPLLDTYNDVNLKNDQNIKSGDLFIPFTDTVDPRLDWTVGRRGIPFLDWSVMRGKDWIRDQQNMGPYLYKKNMFYKSEKFIYSTTSGWATGVNTNNYRAYRYAHILLWRAECAVEMNDLNMALNYVNMIRIRARDGKRVMGLCTTYKLPTGVLPVIDYTQPAANYNVQPYPSFPDQDFARKAVRMELRLEFAMEGHRFFDLVRWGIAEKTMNAYIEKDKLFRPLYRSVTPKVFIKGKNEYWPIPQSAIDAQGKDILMQNPGY